MIKLDFSYIKIMLMLMRLNVEYVNI